MIPLIASLLSVYTYSIQANSIVPLQQPLLGPQTRYKDYSAAAAAAAAATPVEHLEQVATPLNLPPIESLNGIQIQNGYNGLLVPEGYADYLEGLGLKPTEVFSFLHPLIPQTASAIIKFVVKAGAIALAAVAVIVISSIVAAGFCSFSNLCNVNFTGLGWQNENIEESVRAYMTPEKLSSLSEFVHKAIAKYKTFKKKKVGKL